MAVSMLQAPFGSIRSGVVGPNSSASSSSARSSSSGGWTPPFSFSTSNPWASTNARASSTIASGDMTSPGASVAASGSSSAYL